MNERIKLLAQGAGIAVSGDAVYMAHHQDTLDSDALARFAKLIVAECADFLTDTMDDHFAAEQLLDHFQDLA
jgi:hypothetical protein|tara:strand:- start:1786 stop:2001 length:216 start_codon:yes stop_codon:yes gene_type:complete